MGALTNTDITIAAARDLYGGTGQVTINDTNMRYLAGKPQSASGSVISFDDLKGAAYYTSSSGGASIDVRATAVTNGWNQQGPLWFVLTGNSYSSSTGTASLVVSGNFPKGLILQINSGVVVSGKGGAGGNGALGNGGAGAAGGVALAVSSYTGGTLYINNLGTLAGGGGGGGAGGGKAAYYSAPAYYGYGYWPGQYYAATGNGGGGGSGVGGGGTASNANAGAAGTISAGGSGGTQFYGSDGAFRRAGGVGGGAGSAGSTGGNSDYYSYNSYYNTSYYQFNAYGGAGGGAGACTTGTVTAGAVWLNNGTRYGTIG